MFAACSNCNFQLKMTKRRKIMQAAPTNNRAAIPTLPMTAIASFMPTILWSPIRSCFTIWNLIMHISSWNTFRTNTYSIKTRTAKSLLTTSMSFRLTRKSTWRSKWENWDFSICFNFCPHLSTNSCRCCWKGAKTNSNIQPNTWETTTFSLRKESIATRTWQIAINLLK